MPDIMSEQDFENWEITSFEIGIQRGCALTVKVSFKQGSTGFTWNPVFYVDKDDDGEDVECILDRLLYDLLDLLDVSVISEIPGNNVRLDCDGRPGDRVDFDVIKHITKDDQICLSDYFNG